MGKPKTGKRFSLAHADVKKMIPKDSLYRVKARDAEGFDAIITSVATGLPKQEVVVYATRRFLKLMKSRGWDWFCETVLAYHADRPWAEESVLVGTTFNVAEAEVLDILADAVEARREAEPGRRGKVTNPVRASHIVGCAMVLFTETIERRLKREAKKAAKSEAAQGDERSISILPRGAIQITGEGGKTLRIVNPKDLQQVTEEMRRPDHIKVTKNGLTYWCTFCPGSKIAWAKYTPQDWVDWNRSAFHMVHRHCDHRSTEFEVADSSGEDTA